MPPSSKKTTGSTRLIVTFAYRSGLSVRYPAPATDRSPPRYATKAWPNSWMQSEVIQPPTTNRIVRRATYLGRRFVHNSAPDAAVAPTMTTNTGLLTSTPRKEGDGRLRSAVSGRVGPP